MNLATIRYSSFKHNYAEL